MTRCTQNVKDNKSKVSCHPILKRWKGWHIYGRYTAYQSFPVYVRCIYLVHVTLLCLLCCTWYASCALSYHRHSGILAYILYTLQVLIQHRALVYFFYRDTRVRCDFFFEIYPGRIFLLGETPESLKKKSRIPSKLTAHCCCCCCCFLHINRSGLNHTQ